MEQRLTIQRMSKYQSDIKTISSSEEVVFGLLTDLNNLGKLNLNKQDNSKLKILKYSSDSCLLELDPIGRVGFSIIEKTSFNTIKFVSSELPFVVNVWVQLKEVEENVTKLKLTLAAELPSMIKLMFNKKLEKGINLLADFFEKSLNTELQK